MESKQCSKCKQIKALSEFNTRPDRSSGYRSECKNCQYRAQHTGRKRPSKINTAYNKVYRAKKSGKLEPPIFCERCGEPTQLQAHHSDYNKPLEVEWLCPKCHRKIKVA